MEYLTVAFRIVSILIIFLFVTLITGRRHISELPVFDFLIILTLGSVVGADIAQPDISHKMIIFSTVLIIALQYLYGLIIIKSRKIGKLITFGPTVIIQNGNFIKKNLDRLKYSIDTILTLLREKEIFDLNEVEYAIIESTGKISVLKKSSYLALTTSDIGIIKEDKAIPIPVIVEGKVYEENLKVFKLNKEWLNTKLTENNISNVNEVFYASINKTQELYISKYNDNNLPVLEIRH